MDIADRPPTGIVSRIQGFLHTLSYNDQAFFTLIGIIGAVVFTDAIIRKDRLRRVHIEPFGTTALQREGIH